MSDYVELAPTYTILDGPTVRAGDEVFVRGIRDRMLGIGTFAGTLALAEPDGNMVHYPIVEVQGKLLSGGQVDLWSTDPRLIGAHRHAPVYPIDSYLAERAEVDAKLARIVDEALAQGMGVRLD